jgi:hypothetical protein
MFLYFYTKILCNCLFVIRKRQNNVTLQNELYNYSINIFHFRYVGSQKLSEMLQQPYDLYKPGWADAYIMGLINQVRIN